MDKLDLKILQVLDWQGREAVSLIAKKVHASKDVVGYRIKKLEEQHIIMRYFPVLNMGKLGYYTSRLYFDLEEMDIEEEKKFIHFLDTQLHAGLIFRMDYPYHYGIIIWTRSVYDVEKIILRVKQEMKKRLLRYNYTLFCTYMVYPKDYIFGKKFHEEMYLNTPIEKEEFDEEDFFILRELAQHARQSTVQIAQTLKIPQTTVSAKIKMLERKKIILGYRAQIDIAKLGYSNYFLEIYVEDNHHLQDIEVWANMHKNVVWLQKVIGTCDLEIEVEVQGREELELLLGELRKRFPTIRKILFFSQEYKKLTFLPTG